MSQIDDLIDMLENAGTSIQGGEDYSLKPVHKYYYLDSECYQLFTRVKEVGKDNEGYFFIPRGTIFHPQGGGQPDDVGAVIIDGDAYPGCRLEEVNNGSIKPCSTSRSGSGTRLNYED